MAPLLRTPQRKTAVPADQEVREAVTGERSIPCKRSVFIVARERIVLCPDHQGAEGKVMASANPINVIRFRPSIHIEMARGARATPQTKVAADRSKQKIGDFHVHVASQGCGVDVARSEEHTSELQSQ